MRSPSATIHPLNRPHVVREEEPSISNVIGALKVSGQAPEAALRRVAAYPDSEAMKRVASVHAERLEGYLAQARALLGTSGQGGAA